MTDNLELRIATPQSFAPKTEPVQLPSQQGTDAGVLLQKPDIIALINGEGEVPDILTNMVLASLDNKQSGEQVIDQENVGQIFAAMDHICIACFVQPKLWNQDEADDEHIPVKWLSFADKSFVFGWALGTEYQAASSFRPEQGADVDAVQPVSDVPAKSERGHRHTG